MDQVIVAVIGVIGSVATAILLLLLSKVVALFERWTHIQLTEQQKDTIRGAAQTGAGLLEHALAAGTIKLADAHTDNPVVKAITQAAFTNVQESAGALTVTAEKQTEMILGAHGAMLAKAVPIGVPAP
jgi:hypothetical protein